MHREALLTQRLPLTIVTKFTTQFGFLTSDDALARSSMSNIFNIKV